MSEKMIQQSGGIPEDEGGTDIPDRNDKADDPDTDPQLNDNGDENERSPGVPASDPESGA